MKKIIYSIITALLLSVCTILLIPKLLFMGDARWTYRNDAGRVDVHFNGHLKKGRVEAGGTADLQISQPEWLSNENFQGTVIEFPVSYRKKSYQIRLIPQAEEWGKDATIVIELKGRDFWHRGMRRPAWVCFQNITLNGERVAAEKVAWHNTPFVLKYPPPASSKITLTFDVCKPFATSDISCVNFLLVFTAFLFLCLFFAQLRKVANRVLPVTNRKDIVKVLKDGYLHIDPIYRRSFWIIFGVLCCAFGFHTIWFMWGNHDWTLLENTHRWNDHAWEGRYMLYFVKALLSDGIYLPLIHDIIIFLTLALNAVLLCRYWCSEKRVIYYVFCGLVLTVQPFTFCMIYFVNMTPEVFIGVTCVLIALLLSEKVALTGGSVIKKIIYSFIAVVLINFSLAMYAVLLNTIAVVFVGRLLVQSFDWDGSWSQLKTYMRPFMVSVANIVMGIVLYKLIITFVFPIQSYYNTDILPSELLPERLGVLLRQCFRQLYEYDLPFISQWILWIFLGFTLVLVFFICSAGNFKQKVVRLVLLFGALFATQAGMIIAKTHVIAGRVELFGLVFFEVLVMAVVITRLRKHLHNLWCIAGACVIFASLINDLDCLRVWKLGFDAEKMLWNRILARLEMDEKFNPTGDYDIIQIGDSLRTRPRYYTKPGRHDVNCGNYILYDSYDHTYDPFRAPQFYYPVHFRRLAISSAMGRGPSFKSSYEARLKRLYEAGVLQKAEVWPKANGLIVWNDIILFVTDGGELNNVRKRLERELGKK